MLGFFPPRYKDELLYSIFARYYELSASSNFNETLYDFFGSEVNIGVLPRRLEALQERLPVGSVLTALEIIQQHTLFPYFRPFLPVERVDIIQNGMLHSVKWGAKESSGVIQGVIKMPKYLRLCLKCMLEDIEVYKEAYWHRSHQLPGISVCAIHSCKLIDSDVFLNPQLYVSNGRNALYVVKEAFERKFSTVSSLEIKYGCEHEMEIAKGTHWLLNNEVPLLGTKEIKRRYRYYLKKRGYVTASGEVKLLQLADEFEAFYSADFLNELQSNEKVNSWMYRLFRSSATLVVHPLRHILLMYFLGVTPEQFFNNSIENDHPFGVGKWICLNPAADHYKQPVINHCETYRGTYSGHLIGRFTCDCGFVFIRKGPDEKEADRSKIGQVQKYGYQWEARLLKLRDEEKLTFGQIGGKLHVDPHTASKFYKKLKKGEEIKKKKKRAPEDFLYYQKLNRARWLDALENYKGYRKTKIKKIPGTGYLWLYKHDKDWLIEHASFLCQKKKGNTINWRQRDRDLAKKVIMTAKRMMDNEERPKKLTISSIGKTMGDYSTLQFNIKRLVRTCKALESVIESSEDIQIRKLEWAAKQLLDNGEILSAHRLKTLAAVSSKYMTPKVSDKLEVIINENNQ